MNENQRNLINQLEDLLEDIELECDKDSEFKNYVEKQVLGKKINDIIYDIPLINKK